LNNPLLLITPPFTQLNTPYPATAYLKGFLNKKHIQAVQIDLGIKTILEIFSKKGLTDIFNIIHSSNAEYTSNSKRIIRLKDRYIQTIDEVILFLQGKNPTLAHLIGKRSFLPEASRFIQSDEIELNFGEMGIQDKAKFLATMYLEDISDLIKETVDDHFGFSRYAERLGRSANTFDEIYQKLNEPSSYIDSIYLTILEKKINETKPTLIAFSVPFPGNLYSSLKCSQWIKQHHPGIKVAMGGGFANTELRNIKDPRVFEFYDFITLDDGESPIENLIKYVNNETDKHGLKRTFLLEEGVVEYYNNKTIKDYKQAEVGTPDYSDLLLDKYISAIEVANPMHRLWSDGRWNKLTMAHGCYWGKCTFCDISLDYIKLYEPIAAAELCDRMEELIAQTGQTGFHFVDEAAPPSLMKALAIEILKRKLVLSWWTNVRFEKSFTRDLCLLLKASGCIAVSGGLEVASDRLLELIEKGITVSQVAKVNRNFTDAGIMVHAYLMYGFPSQTAQETIDSMEMVRQLFKTGVLHSAFWHQFAMTVHSPIGLNPSKYNVTIDTKEIGTFANNDLQFTDPTGTDHEAFSFGLKKSLFNYMQNRCLDEPLQKWYDFKIPKTTIDKDFIENALSEIDLRENSPNSKIIWTGITPSVECYIQSKKGMQREMATLFFSTNTGEHKIQLIKNQAEWLLTILEKTSIYNSKTFTLKEIKEDYEQNGMDDFELFWDNKPMNTLYKAGLLIL
jgi:radical SAM superfamily enzyme YgiQ (UPF0313 family)